MPLGTTSSTSPATAAFTGPCSLPSLRTRPASAAELTARSAPIRRFARRRQLEGPELDVAGPPIGGDDDAARRNGAAGHREAGGNGALAEEPLARAHRDRIDLEQQLVDQVVLQQRLNQ